MSLVANYDVTNFWLKLASSEFTFYWSTRNFHEELNKGWLYVQDDPKLRLFLTDWEPYPQVPMLPSTLRHLSYGGFVVEIVKDAALRTQVELEFYNKNPENYPNVNYYARLLECLQKRL